MGQAAEQASCAQSWPAEVEEAVLACPAEAAEQAELRRLAWKGSRLLRWVCSSWLALQRAKISTLHKHIKVFRPKAQKLEKHVMFLKTQISLIFLFF